MPEKATQKGHGKKTAPPSEKEVQPEVVIQIPLAELHPFPDHPFQVRDDDSMRETAESVKAYGVLVPAIVRPREEGGYEIISGHRRKHACELAGLASMPAIVRNMDRDTATIIMVDSNLQRENILPSERANSAYADFFSAISAAYSACKLLTEGSFCMPWSSKNFFAALWSVISLSCSARNFFE